MTTTRCGQMIKAVRHESPEALTTATVELLRQQLACKSAQSIMLAGGSTPMEAYRRLAELNLRPGGHLRVCFSDDRHVPPDSPKSNFGNTRSFLDALGIDPSHILRVFGEVPLETAVSRYDKGLRELIAADGPLGLGLLGLGADGHTASLFSRGDIESAKGRYAIGVNRPDGLQGVSVTPEFLRNVRRLVFLVAGADKKPMTEALLKRADSIAAGLATLNHPNVELWTDAAAWPL